MTDFILGEGGSKIAADGDCSHEIKRPLLLGRKAMTNLHSIIKSRGITFANKGPSSQSYSFSSCHVWIWELDYKESWALKNWYFWKEIQPVHSKGNQSWIFIGRSDAEAQTPILSPPDVKNWLICKGVWYWERLKAGGEEEDREWDGWMTSPTQWTWVWVNSGSWQ